MAALETYNKNKPRDFMGELFEALETAQEGAELVYHLRLVKGIDAEALKKSLHFFCETYPKLRGPAHSSAQAVEQIWLERALNEAEKHALRISLKNSPPIRMFYTDTNEICVICHHSLGDGFSGYRFFTQWLRRADDIQSGITVVECVVPRTKSLPAQLGPLKTMMIFASAMLRRKLLAWLWPPEILGEKMPPPVVVRSQIRKELGTAELKDIETLLKEKFPDCSLNVWLIRCFVLALAKFKNHAQGRIAVYMSMDIRNLIGDPDYFFNAVSGYQIDTSAKDRANDKALFKKILKSRNKYASASRLLFLYRFLRVLFAMKEKFRLNLAGVKKDSWRYSCTANISNILKLPALDSKGSLIEGIYSAPLTMAPIGFTCGIYLVGGKLCLGFNYANYALNDEQAELLVNIFLNFIKGYDDDKA